VRKIIVAALALLVVLPATAQATGGKPGHGDKKAYVCHKGKTLKIGKAAVKAHLRHGDKYGACSTNGGGNGGGNTDTPVTAATFEQVNRILACAAKPVMRHADGSIGIAVDLDLATYESGFYADTTFTVARWYAPIPGVHPGGATCEKLGGAPNGATVDGYPVWIR
jgi:hypothetical protein